ncbi:MAG: abortive infection system antitoxin AbiGi family protein [Thermodesulfobacteriota bacterium]
MSSDNGYISDYLIHWAGRDKSPEERVSVLSRIVTDCRLRLTRNEFFFNGSLKFDEEMVCFTDVPLARSQQHCAKYSQFGIAFYKKQLMGKGAQPVFYFTHVFKKDMGRIHRFVIEQLKNSTIAPDVLRALHRQIYFTQQFAEGPADRHDIAYYEREWRIGPFSLKREGQDFLEWYSEHDRLTPITGILVTEGDEQYFKFEQADVAFLIAPNQFIAQISNPHQFAVKSYESLVKQTPVLFRLSSWLCRLLRKKATFLFSPS